MSFADGTPQERRLLASAAGNMSWAKTEDRSARTEPARQAFNQRFYNQVDPDRILPPEEREKRAENARRAYFAEMSRKAARAARKRREDRRENQEASNQLAALVAAAPQMTPEQVAAIARVITGTDGPTE